jgi:hypothetical protein
MSCTSATTKSRKAEPLLSVGSIFNLLMVVCIHWPNLDEITRFLTAVTGLFTSVILPLWAMSTYSSKKRKKKKKTKKKSR